MNYCVTPKRMSLLIVIIVALVVVDFKYRRLLISNKFIKYQMRIYRTEQSTPAGSFMNAAKQQIRKRWGTKEPGA